MARWLVLLGLLLLALAPFSRALPGAEPFLDVDDSDESDDDVDDGDDSAGDEEKATLSFNRMPATFNTARLLAERRQAEVLKNMGNGVPPIGTVSWKPAKSCDEIKDEWGKMPSGVYYIWYKRAGKSRVQVFKTYCDMDYNGHIWTFIPRAAVIKGSENRDFIKELFKEKSEVLFVINQPGRSHKQRYTTIRQLSEYSHHNLELTLNEHGTAVRPTCDAMGPYLYLQVLPPAEAAKKTHQGFQSNGKDAKFTNCYAKRNNYWALFPNWKNVAAPKGNVHCNTNPCVAWVTSGKTMVGAQQIPNENFFYFEMSFGLQSGTCGHQSIPPGGFQDPTVAIAVRAS